jgi:hypothetical protein
MPTTQPDTLRRLRAANPVPVQVDRGHTPRARETLDRIVAEPSSTEQRPPKRIRPRLSRGGLGVVVAVALVGGGAAVAATNPFGWWSANPDTAKYAVNPTTHVPTPSAAAIRCRTTANSAPACSSAGSGQLYTRIDTIKAPPANALSRANFLKQIALAEAAHRLSAAKADQFRHDLAQVPDSFFDKLRVALRYGTYSGGASNGRVPPQGVPEFLVCGQNGSALTCRDLNGDQGAPIGAGVYMAQPGRDWRPAPPQRTDAVLPGGLRFTPAEYRVLEDVVAGVTTTSSSASPQPHALPTGRPSTK